MTAPILRLEPAMRAARPVPVPAGTARVLALRPRRPGPARRPIGTLLVETGRLAPANLDRALALQSRRPKARLGEIMVAEGMLTPGALAAGLALQRGAAEIDPLRDPPDPGLIDALGPDRCLALGVLPWRRVGGATVVATARPESFAAHRAELERALGPVAMAVGAEVPLRTAVLARRGQALVRRAEARPPRDESVRGLAGPGLSLAVLAALAALLLAGALAPVWTFTALALWAILALVLMTGLRAAAAIAELGRRIRLARRFRTARIEPAFWPHISVMVPLLRESAVTDDLLARLSALDYPRERLEILLVTEAADPGTAEALAARTLPDHVRHVAVPAGQLRTKPRALNYALDLCRGEIVGVWDAEDAPEPDQLRRIARHFAAAPPDVACLQGRLDFYNPRQNWLSRCFTVDYATWFRVILPGLDRLGFAIPLGGTTLFFRRAALEALGRWDAHNVTEDADLGIRLARRGFRTELADTVTREEANCRLGPWIRQRTRWLKGYMLTYAVHMRRPVRLWRDLGPRRFLGVQVLFLGTVSLFLLAPLLWSFWLLPLGFGHPLDALVPAWALALLCGFFVLSELLTIATEALAVSVPRKRWLLPWVITLHFYYPLAAIAAWRALLEIAVRPYYWDKTDHGRAVAGGAEAAG